MTKRMRHNRKQYIVFGCKWKNEFVVPIVMQMGNNIEDSMWNILISEFDTKIYDRQWK